MLSFSLSLSLYIYIYVSDVLKFHASDVCYSYEFHVLVFLSIFLIMQLALLA